MKIIFILIFSTLLLSAKDDLGKISLQLQWLEQFQFAGYFIAKEKGFYRDVGLEVNIHRFNLKTDSVKLIQSNKIDYAIGRSSLILDYANGANIVLLKSIFQLSPLILLTTIKHSIKTLQDIRGKRIMNVNDARDSIAFRSMLSANGIDYENDIIELPHSFDVNDLVQNKTDLMVGYISNEPYVLKKLGEEYIYFSPKDYGLEFYDDILFTSQDELKNHPKRVKKFIDASLKGWEWAFGHIKESALIIHKKYNTQNKSLEALIYEGKELKKLAYHSDTSLGEIKIEKLKTTYNIYKSMGLVNKDIDLRSFIYQDLTFTQKIGKFFKHHIDNRNFFKAMMILMLLVMVSFYLNFALNRKVNLELEKIIDQERLIFKQNKLISMGEMMESIAHQWRQPLSNINSIILNIDQDHRQNNTKKLDQRISQIEDITAYMSETIDDFSTYLSPQYNKKNFKIKKAVEIAIKLTEPLYIKNHIKIDFKDADDIEFFGYKNELVQVIITILNNASEALKSINNPLVKLMIEKEKKKITITIIDNGKGIKKENLNKIFDPYFSTKHKTLGTGLGLYIAKMIVTQDFNGYIDVQVDKNNTFFKVILNEKT